MVEILPGRASQVGSLPVRRVLPHRPRRTVGAWCFADHMGPVALRQSDGVATAGIGPHPHMGLQTVTWLVAGELVHRDSLGSEQLIRPGQLNLMTAGHGVAHAEEDPGRATALHGIQLWVAQPEETRHGAPAFEHHATLPQLEVAGATATVLMGSFAGTESPAGGHGQHFGVELLVPPGRCELPLRPTDEHGVIVLEGAFSLGGSHVEPGVLAYLGAGRDGCAIDAPAASRLMLLGGPPFPETLRMWWNFVARSDAEIVEGWRQWTADDGRFGRVASELARIEVDRPPWG